MRIFINMNTILMETSNIKNEEDLMDVSFYDNASVNQKAKDVIEALISKGYNTYILSYCIYNNSIQRKREWIKNNLPKINEKNILLFNQSINYFNYIKNGILFDDIYLDTDKKRIAEFGLEGGKGIYFDVNEIDTVTKLEETIQRELVYVEKINKFENKENKNLYHYKVSYINHDEHYEGFLKSELSQEEVQNLLLKKTDIINKPETAELSYLMKKILKNILSNIDDDSHIIERNKLNHLIQKIHSNYSNIATETLLDCFEEDIININKTYKDKKYITNNKDDIIINNDIILLFDFFQEHKNRNMRNRLNVEYFLTRNQNIVEEIEQITFLKEGKCNKIKYGEYNSSQ